MLVLSGALLKACTTNDGNIELQETSFAALEFDWHSEDEPRTTMIDIVRSDSLIENLDNMVLGDDRVEEELHQVRQSFKVAAEPNPPR